MYFSLTDSVTLAVSVVCGSIWTFFTVLPKNLIRKPFLMVAGVKMPGIGVGGGSDFRELSFCGPKGTLFLKSEYVTQ